MGDALDAASSYVDQASLGELLGLLSRSTKPECITNVPCRCAKLLINRSALCRLRRFCLVTNAAVDSLR